MRPGKLLPVVVIGAIAGCASIDVTPGLPGDDATDTGADADTDSDTDGDTDTDIDADADGDTDPGGPVCDDEDDCDGEPCVDGFCCDGPCDGVCEYCGFEGVAGTCTPVPAGEDPRDDCPAQPAETCGTTGWCDGAGGCEFFGPETLCDDGEVCTVDDACDGQGNCVGQPPSACDPGPDNECCEAACSDVEGCYTTAGDCEETCEANQLIGGRTCEGCGPQNAEGACSTGTAHACSAGDHNLCEEVSCGGETYRCTNAGGTWGWRTAAGCDDGNACTTGTSCQGEVCGGGTPVSCPAGSGCCQSGCDPVMGCITSASPGACPDSCTAGNLVVGASCDGCGPAGAHGTCSEGSQHPCNAANACGQTVCGGSTYQCRFAGSAWGWTGTPCEGGTVCDDATGTCKVIECWIDADCTSPPPNTCVGNAARQYPNPGICADNVCTYPHTDTECVAGGNAYCDGTTYFNPAPGTCTGGACVQGGSANCGAAGCTVVSGTGQCKSAVTTCQGRIQAMLDARVGAGATMFSWETGDEGWSGWTRGTQYKRTGDYGVYASTWGNVYRNFTANADLSTCGENGCTVVFGYYTRRGNWDQDGLVRARCSGNSGSSWSNQTAQTAGFSWTSKSWTMPSACLTSSFRASLHQYSQWGEESNYAVDDVTFEVGAYTNRGNFDGATPTVAWGWACSSADWNAELDVRLYFYKDQNMGGTPIQRVIRANVFGQDLVNANVCNGTGNHRFHLQPDATLLGALGSGSHTVRAFAVLPGPCGGADYQIGTDQTLTI